MRTVVDLWPLLLLGSVWANYEDLIQHDFDLDRFMGQWYEVAMVSTCPHYMHRKRSSPVVVALDLRHVALQRNFTVTATDLRDGACKQTTALYNLTDLPGKFFHHVPRFTADVYSYVLHADYSLYAVLLQLSTERPSGILTTTVKLLTRTANVTSPGYWYFERVATDHGFSNDSIIINKDVCTDSLQVVAPASQPQISVPNESEKRNALPPAENVIAWENK